MDLNNVKISANIPVGNTGRIVIKASNYLSKEQKATLIVAVYDKSTNRMIECNKCDTEVILPGNEKLLEVSIKNKIKDGQVVKFFIWDSMEGMNPLCNEFCNNSIILCINIIMK